MVSLLVGGVSYQDSTGGVLRVELGSSATFEVPVSFEGNSVTNMNSGGAVYAGGAVRARDLIRVVFFPSSRS